MSELFRVFANEWMKLIRRLRLWVTVGMAILIVSGLSFIQYSTANFYDPIGQFQESIQMEKQMLQEAQNKLSQIQKGAIDAPEEVQLQAEIQQHQQNIQLMKQQLEEETQLRTGDWRIYVNKQIAQFQEQMKSKDMDEDDKKIAEAHIKYWQYFLDHNIRPITHEPTAYKAMQDLMFFMIAIFVPMLVVVMTGDIVSGETTSGTIKLLLVRPVSRAKIMFAKWLTAVVATTILVVGFFAALYGTNILLYDKAGGEQVEWVNVEYKEKLVQNPGEPKRVERIPVYDNAELVPMSEIYWTGCGLTVISMIAVATITFLFSTLFKSAMVSTGVSLAVVIVGNILTQMIHNGKYLSWLFSVHINLVRNWTGELSRDFGTTLTLEFGILVLAIWTIASLIGAIVYFQRKDILNA